MVARRVGLVTEGRLCCVEAVGGVVCRCCECAVALVVGVVAAGIVGGGWLSVWGLVCMPCVGIGVRGWRWWVVVAGSSWCWGGSGAIAMDAVVVVSGGVTWWRGDGRRDVRGHTRGRCICWLTRAYLLHVRARGVEGRTCMSSGGLRMCQMWNIKRRARPI